MAEFPTSAKVFSARSNGQVVDASHINDLQDEVNAISDGYLNASARLNSSNSTVANLSVTGGSTFAGKIAGSSGLSIAGNSTLASGTGESVSIGGGAAASELRFLEPSGSGTNYMAFKAQAMAANVTYTLPAADGSANQVLQTDGAGTLSWATGSVAVKMVSLEHSAGQAVTTSAALTYDTEKEDVGGLHDAGSNTRVTVPAGAGGVWLFGATVRLAAGAAGGSAQMYFRKNGTTQLHDGVLVATTLNLITTISLVVTLVATDYVEVWIQKSTGDSWTFGDAAGGAKNQMTAMRLGD